MAQESELTWEDLDVLEALRLHPDRTTPSQLEMAADLIGKDVAGSLERLFANGLVQRKENHPWPNYQTVYAYLVNTSGHELLKAAKVCRRHVGHLLGQQEKFV